MTDPNSSVRIAWVSKYSASLSMILSNNYASLRPTRNELVIGMLCAMITY